MRESANPVKFFAALLWADEAARDGAVARLREFRGDVDFEGADHEFDSTDYYAREMGSTLWRRLVSFARLAPPEDLVDAKVQGMALEDAFRRQDRRRVNIDVGYVDLDKVVLGSTKYQGQKIHLGRGVYADPVCRYRKGHYGTFEWTFPDFRDGRYEKELLEIRRLYKAQLRG